MNMGVLVQACAVNSLVLALIPGFKTLWLNWEKSLEFLLIKVPSGINISLLQLLDV